MVLPKLPTKGDTEGQKTMMQSRLRLSTPLSLYTDRVFNKEGTIHTSQL